MAEAEELIENMGKSLSVLDGKNDPNVRKLIEMRDGAVNPAADAFKNNPSPLVKYGTATVLSGLDPEKLSQDSKETVIDALLIGIRQEKRIQDICFRGLENAKLMDKEVDGEVKGKVVDALKSLYNSNKSDSRWAEGVVSTLASIDYSNAHKVKVDALDFLVGLSCIEPTSGNFLTGPQTLAARWIDKMGDESAKNKVVDHWRPFLDSRDNFERYNAYTIFSEMKWEPAADKAAEILRSGNGRIDIQESEYLLLRVVAKSGNAKHEDAIIEGMKKSEGWKRSDHMNLQDWFETLGKIGGEKSKQTIKEFVEREKNDYLAKMPVNKRSKAGDDWRGWIEARAQETTREIDGRIGVSKAPAVKQLEESMGKKPVKVT